MWVIFLRHRVRDYSTRQVVIGDGGSLDLASFLADEKIETWVVAWGTATDVFLILSTDMDDYILLESIHQDSLWS